MYDLVIVGAGPAGATLARLLGDRYRILVLERRNAQDAGKCCGGLIAPDAQRMLAEMGLGIPKSLIVSPQLFSVRTIDMDHGIERFYGRNYLNIDRKKFEDWLISMIPSSVEFHWGATLKSFRSTVDGVTVVYHANGKSYEVQARRLIGADGGKSQVRKRALPEAPEPETYIAIEEWFHTQEGMDYYGAMFHSETTDFYSWTIPKDGALILGAALKPGSDAPEKFRRLKSKFAEYGLNLGEPFRRESAFIFRPTSLNQISYGQGSILLVGEAAGFISPSSAEGFSYAFRSAIALAKALQSAGESTSEAVLKRYKNETRGLRWNIRYKNLKSPAMYWRPLRKWILKSGLLSVNK